MREEPGQTCTESTNNSSNISDSKESLMSVIDHTNMSAEAGDNKPQSTNEFDDSCFKTPELPNRNRRKLGVRMNGHINELSSCTNGSRVKTEPIDSLKKLTLDSDNTSKTLDSNDADETKPSIEDLCELKPSTSSLSDVSETRSQSPLKSPTKTSSAKGSSYTCPHTKKFLSTAFPKLPAKSLSDKELDLLNEIIIDEFSLLVFRSLDDYKVFKVEEDEKIAREKLLADEAKRKADEPIISTTPCAKNNNMIKKKVGRKSKAEKAREEEERRRLKAERKEQRKRERREHRLREKRELKAKGLLPKRKEKRTEEEKQRHLEEKQRQKEEKRLEKERLREEKRQLKIRVSIPCLKTLMVEKLIKYRLFY
uniref:Uncharacterized protein n=1 Tax=Acrobeloides nanus TaxID=290746 RepID=A0A914DPN7_9BILA